MKYPTLATLLLLLSFSAMGQKLRFTDSSNVWKIRRLQYETWGYSHWYSSYTGAAVINGHVYKILSSISGPSTYVREDTAAGKVYVRPVYVHAAEDTVERVLIDHNWQVNDTAIYTNTGVTYKNIVTDIDSVVINGIQHKVWHFSCAVKNYSVIEGIGCLIFPDFPLYPNIFEIKEDLICYSNSTGSPSLSKSIDLFDNALSCALGSTLIATNKLQVIPNPVSSVAKIVLPERLQAGILTIMNATGKTIYNNNVDDTDEIIVNAKYMANGLYLYLIYDKQTGTTLTGKFIKGQ